MMANLIVTLLSDQAIPNVLFIKHMQQKLNSEGKKYDHLFISTERMNTKGVGNWISNVCGITSPQVVVVEHNNLTDISKKLSETCMDDYEKYYVNITGGTKLMSIGVSDFFKAKSNARIYYIDGQKSWLLFPQEERYCANLADNITLKEYVESYGFELREDSLSDREDSLSDIDFKYTKHFLNKYIGFTESEMCVLSALRSKRAEGIKQIDEIMGLQDLLCAIDFPTQNQYQSLNKYEVRYLTGGWFEEYIYYRLIEENIIKESDLKTGIKLYKLDKNLQRIKDKKGNPIDNEFDIVCIYKTKFYAIECKTSIFDGEKNFVNETIYKSVTLKNKLGLFSTFIIFTLSSKGDKKVDVQDKHLKRAEDSEIKVFCREDILGCESISQLLGLC